MFRRVLYVRVGLLKIGIRLIRMRIIILLWVLLGSLKLENLKFNTFILLDKILILISSGIRTNFQAQFQTKIEESFGELKKE